MRVHFPTVARQVAAPSQQLSPWNTGDLVPRLGERGPPHTPVPPPAPRWGESLGWPQNGLVWSSTRSQNPRDLTKIMIKPFFLVSLVSHRPGQECHFALGPLVWC